MIKAKKIIITGDVQGVSFRYFAKREAIALGLSGYARNEHDGTVSVFVQGPEEKIADFLTWAEEGSPMATVSAVKVTEAKSDETIRGFEVK